MPETATKAVIIRDELAEVSEPQKSLRVLHLKFFIFSVRYVISVAPKYRAGILHEAAGFAGNSSPELSLSVLQFSLL